MTSKELFTEMETHWNEFNDNHSKFIEKGNRAAATRARKALQAIAVAVKERRKEITEEKNAL